MSDLFLRTLNISLSASWLVLAVVVLRFCMKKAPKWVDPVLWGIVALRLIFPVSIESVLSLLPSAQPIPPDIAYAAQPAINSGFPAVNRAVNPVISQSFAPAPAASVNPLQIWLEIGGWLWLAGMAVMLLYTAFSYLRLRRRVGTAVHLRGNQYQCETVSSPFVLGLMRPRIYLPFGLREEDLFYIVAHEEAHIRRRDHWWKPLGFALLAVHWFNPLMWLAYILLCRDIEMACDERVIRQLNRDGRADYSQALLSCSVSRRSIAACPLAFGEVGVKERVKSVLNYKKPGFWIVALAVASCTLLAVCFLTNPKEEKELPTIQPGEYWGETVMYSTLTTVPENETVKDLLNCKVLEDNGLLIKPIYENGASSNWNSINKLEPYEFTNETLGELIRMPNAWLSGSLEDIGAITDARIAQHQQTNEEFVFFCTEDGGFYLAKYAEAGPPCICYLVKLGMAAPLETAPIEDAAKWGVSLKVEDVSPTGATVVFECSGEAPEGELLGGNDYVLQKYDIDAWVDVPTTLRPNWVKASYPLDIRRHEIDWTWLYGELPDGQYRIGKRAYLRSDNASGGSAMAWAEFQLGTKELTLEDVRRLARKGEDLSLSDFSGFACESTGSNIRRYDLEDPFSLCIVSTGRKPQSIALRCEVEDDAQIDIRRGDIDAFLKVHQRDLPLLSNNHWGLSFGVTDVTPTGALAMFWAKETTEGVRFLCDESYVLQTKDRQGNWVPVASSKEPKWSRDNTFTYAVQEIQWDWLGALSDGEYRLGKWITVHADHGARTEQFMVYANFGIHAEGKNGRILTAEDLTRLLDDPENLDWKDFEGFVYYDEDNGDLPYPQEMRYMRHYTMPGDLRLHISAPSKAEPILRILVTCEADEDIAYMFPRETEPSFQDENITRAKADALYMQEFLELHSRIRPNENTNHWGVTFALESVSPNEAYVQFEADLPIEAELKPSDQYSLWVLKGGQWVGVPTLPGQEWPEDAVFSEDNLKSQTISWESRYGTLPAGTYRLQKYYRIQGEEPSFEDRGFQDVYADFTID